MVSEVVVGGVGGVRVSNVNFWKPFEVKSYLAGPDDKSAAAAELESQWWLRLVVSQTLRLRLC